MRRHWILIATAVAVLSLSAGAARAETIALARGGLYCRIEQFGSSQNLYSAVSESSLRPDTYPPLEDLDSESDVTGSAGAYSQVLNDEIWARAYGEGGAALDFWGTFASASTRSEVRDPAYVWTEAGNLAQGFASLTNVTETTTVDLTVSRSYLLDLVNMSPPVGSLHGPGNCPPGTRL